MVEFSCDDKAVEKALRKLYKQVVANGGIVHDKLIIGCEKGDFKIRVAGDVPRGEKILVLPKECLLPVDKYKLDLKGNNIVMTSHDKDLSKGQVAMMKTMIELYNLTGKIATQKKIATLSLYYEDRDFLDVILKSRSRQGIPFLDGMVVGPDKKTFYLDSFIKTRVLAFKDVENESGDKKGAGKEAEKEFKRTKVLMPIIDFINHHSAAIGFLTRFAEESAPEIKPGEEHTHDADGIAVVKSCPVEGSDECYVNYGPYDAMDALIHYNYADKGPGFMRSVPMEIKLPGGVGTIRIKSVTGQPHHKKLPEHLKDLNFYIPGMGADKDKKTVNLSFIYLPPDRAPRSMRRVLVLAINHLGVPLNQEQMTELVQFAEKRIIDENLKYFKALSAYLKKYKPKPAVKLIAKNARDVATIQLEHVKNYPFFAETRGKSQKNKKIRTRA